MIDKETGLKGDNDPIDAIEIGSKLAQPGEVKQVKVLGALALLDEGETDWKIVVVDVTDALAERLNDSSDIEKVCPGLIDATRHWLRVYKVPDGKPENQFAFDGELKDRSFALNIIEETHRSWKALIGGKVDAKKEGSYDISVSNSTISESPGYDASPNSIENASEKCSVDVSSHAPAEIYYV